jgi:hypothetical protein
VTNLGSKAVFRTNRHAKNFKLIQIDLEQPAESSWVDLVAEHRQDQEFGGQKKAFWSLAKALFLKKI